MLELVRTTFAKNARVALVGVAAFALGGAGAVASVTLSGNQMPAPATSQSTGADTADTQDPAEAQDPAETQDPAEEQDPAESQDATDTGARPTDTHGFCVSHAVAAAHALGKTGKDVAAFKQSCAKPGKSTASHGKSGAKHGQSTQPHGKAHTHP